MIRLRNIKNRPDSGFTVLELLIVVAIIGTLAVFVLPGIDTWTAKRSYRNLYHDLVTQLAEARSEAQIRATTLRVLTSRNGDNYTVTTFFSPAPVANCNAAGVWTQLSQVTLEAPTLFEITGNGIGNVCFYRDGSASGGQYNVVQKDGGNDIGGAAVTVTIATGYLDVTT